MIAIKIKLKSLFSHLQIIRKLVGWAIIVRYLAARLEFNFTFIQLLENFFLILCRFYCYRRNQLINQFIRQR